MGDKPASAARTGDGETVDDSCGGADLPSDDPEISTGFCEIHASFEILPKEGCVLASLQEDAEVIQHYFTDTNCEVLLERAGDSTDIVRGETIDTAVCPLLTMSDYGASSVVKEVTDDGYVVDAYLSDAEDLWPLIDDLRRVTDDLTVRRIVDLEEEDVSPTASSIDLCELTAKQRTALAAAVREGYFERPRQTSQAELAEQFDISKQAMARRLARAERAIFEQLPLD